MKSIRNILLISRATPYCPKGIQYSIGLARSFNAQLYILHLVSNPVEMMAVNVPGMFPGEVFPTIDYTSYKSIQMEAKKQLATIIKTEVQEGFPIKELVSDQDPVDEIVKVVSEEKIDLIVMLAHEEGRIEHALFGGENDAILRKIPCSIMLLKNEPEVMECSSDIVSDRLAVGD